jgi:hypothetical protein
MAITVQYNPDTGIEMLLFQKEDDINITSPAGWVALDLGGPMYGGALHVANDKKSMAAAIDSWGLENNEKMSALRVLARAAKTASSIKFRRIAAAISNKKPNTRN